MSLLIFVLTFLEFWSHYIFQLASDFFNIRQLYSVSVLVYWFLGLSWLMGRVIVGGFDGGGDKDGINFLALLPARNGIIWCWLGRWLYFGVGAKNSGRLREITNIYMVLLKNKWVCMINCQYIYLTISSMAKHYKGNWSAFAWN